MIKILLNWGYVEFEKDNKGYKCCREYNEYNGKTIIYSLYVWNTTTYKSEPRIRSESLEDINKWLAKTEVEIVED